MVPWSGPVNWGIDDALSLESVRFFISKIITYLNPEIGCSEEIGPCFEYSNWQSDPALLSCVGTRERCTFSNQVCDFRREEEVRRSNWDDKQEERRKALTCFYVMVSIADQGSIGVKSTIHLCHWEHESANNGENKIKTTLLCYHWWMTELLLVVAAAQEVHVGGVDGCRRLQGGKNSSLCCLLPRNLVCWALQNEINWTKSFWNVQVMLSKTCLIDSGEQVEVEKWNY